MAPTGSGDLPPRYGSLIIRIVVMELDCLGWTGSRGFFDLVPGCGIGFLHVLELEVVPKIEDFRRQERAEAVALAHGRIDGDPHLATCEGVNRTGSFSRPRSCGV
jgi:hypothetical protein